MNQIVHETVNNTVFDVDTKMHFKEVYEIFENKDHYKLSIISKDISEFKFSQNQWVDLISLINPFSSNIVMTDSQKLSFPFFNFIINNASNDYIILFCNQLDPDTNKTLISMLGVINNGYKLFKYLDKIDTNKKILWKKNGYLEILDVARYGNIQNYLFLESKLTPDEVINCQSNFNNVDIFANMCVNPDMRLFKYFLDKYSCYFSLDSKNIANLYFKGIFGNHIPYKYQMRRIKLLNNYYDLDHFYSTMIDNNYLEYKTMKTISKFYYKTPIFSIGTYSSSLFVNIRNNIIRYYEEDGIEIIKYFYKLFSSLNINDLQELIKVFFNLDNLDIAIIEDLNQEIISNGNTKEFNMDNLFTHSEIRIKVASYLNRIIKYKNEYEDFDYENKISEDALWNSLKYYMNSSMFYNSSSINEFLKSSIRGMFHSASVLHERFIVYLVLLTKIPFNPQKLGNINMIFYRSICKGIRIKSLLKKALFRKINNSRKKQKINFKVLLNHLVTFKPDYDIPVLSKGSNLYRMNKQKLIKHKYPIHIDPCQMIWLSKRKCFLREKADGIYTDSISFQHYPQVNIFNSSVIKSEFLEDDNLHLVFDIDLDENIKGRYKYLRMSHPFTKDSAEILEITSIYDFKVKLDSERKRFLNFKNYVEENDIIEPIWYPKAAWLIKENTSVISDLTRIITNLNESQDYDFLINQTEFPIDGFIVQPLDGSTEAKIKPNDQMTVDLLFDGSNWLTREKRKITNMNCDGIKLSKNIWRCYWIDGKWIPREIRWDKKIPNPNNIVDYLVNYNTNKWQVEDILKINSSYYFQTKCDINYDMIKIFKKQREIQFAIFQKAECRKNAKWLDIGCGKGNSIKNINCYNPSEYLGFDNDPYCVWESQMRHSGDYHNFSLFDFSNEKNKNEFISTNKINDVFDYLVCNFVLHYSAISAEIWNRWINKINERSKSGSIIFVNFMDYEKLSNVAKNNKFEIDGSCSIKLLEDGEYNTEICPNWAEIKFNWVHPEPIKEPILEKLTICSQFESNGWKLQDEFNLNNYKNSSFSFCSIYTWLTFIKK